MNAPLTIAVQTAHPVAATSLDHLEPRGTAVDNSRNPRFNQKLQMLFAGLGRAPRVLDLGCAGGGFVRSCLLEGIVAVGIEGSDYSARQARAEWPLLGGRFLFTADISQPLAIAWSPCGDPLEPMTFDVVTMWEVFEHIAESDLAAVCATIRAHLRPGGLLIASISDEALRHHQTCHPRSWWEARLAGAGLVSVPAALTFFGTEFVRGPKSGDTESFHIVVTNDLTQAPAIPAPRLKDRVLDRVWFGSRVYRALRTLLNVT